MNDHNDSNDNNVQQIQAKCNMTIMTEKPTQSVAWLSADSRSTLHHSCCPTTSHLAYVPLLPHVSRSPNFLSHVTSSTHDITTPSLHKGKKSKVRKCPWLPAPWLGRQTSSVICLYAMSPLPPWSLFSLEKWWQVLALNFPSPFVQSDISSSSLSPSEEI